MENGTKCHVICVDAKSGAILWAKHVFDQQPRRKESKNSYATSTPTTDGRQVYAVFGDGSVVALTTPRPTNASGPASAAFLASHTSPRSSRTSMAKIKSSAAPATDSRDSIREPANSSGPFTRKAKV
jgi:hypothetical protein